MTASGTVEEAIRYVEDCVRRWQSGETLQPDVSITVMLIINRFLGRLPATIWCVTHDSNAGEDEPRCWRWLASSKVATGECQFKRGRRAIHG